MTVGKARQRTVIGWREWVGLPDLATVPVKAKVDTGARTSTLHAFGLVTEEDAGQPSVSFEIHPVQRSTLHRAKVTYPVHGFKVVRSSTGHSERRPVIRTRVEIGEHEFDIDITLTSRDRMGFRMLLGRSALRRRFWVDPGRSFIHAPKQSDQ